MQAQPQAQAQAQLACACLQGTRLDPQHMLPGKAAPLSLQSSEQARQKDMIPGFIRAKEVVTLRQYPPPEIPADYQPIHRPSKQPSAGAPELHLNLCNKRRDLIYAAAT